MRILSFDTSSPDLTAALMEDGKIVASRRIVPSESSRQEAVSQLMPAIDEITAGAGWERDSIDLVVVGVGPGSFTGMRTSVVTARTLAQTLDVGLIGINSLECYASLLPLPATIVLSGGRGHFFVASYACGVPGKARWEPGDACMKCVLEPCCLTSVDFAAALQGAERVFVEEKILDDVRSHFPNCQPLPRELDTAVVQAHLADSNFKLCNKDRDKLKSEYTYYTVNPLYLRGASITMKAKHESGSRD